MAIHVARSGHLPPGDRWVPGFQIVGQTARCFGDDFEATGHRIEGSGSDPEIYALAGNHAHRERWGRREYARVLRQDPRHRTFCDKRKIRARVGRKRCRRHRICHHRICHCDSCRSVAPGSPASSPGATHIATGRRISPSRWQSRCSENTTLRQNDSQSARILKTTPPKLRTPPLSVVP